MKILFYNHTGRVSGAERVLLMILTGTDSERSDTTVLCPADGPLTQMISELAMKTRAIDALAARFTWRPDLLIKYMRSLLDVVRKVRSIVIAESPDVVYANSIRAGLVMSLATVGLGVTVIWHVHDLLPHHPLSSVIRLFTVASGRNRIVAVSSAVAQRFRGVLLRLFPSRAPITVIHNAVDVVRFQPNDSARQETRRALNFGAHQLVIGSVGQLTPRKGQLELLEAFAEVTKAHPSATLVIVGGALFNRDFEYADNLKERVETLRISDRVHFLGQREDIANLMRAFDLLVVNSHAEPFGLTIVEAMASGTPVLATAVDGIREIIRHDQSGWLVKRGDHHALVEALDQLISDSELRRRLSSKALPQAHKRFPADRFLKEIENLYRNVFEQAVTSRGGTARNQIECGLKT